MNAKRRKKLENDVKIFKLVVAFIFFVLFLRLGWLQIIEAEIYRTKALNNRMRLVTIPATRGNIITSDGAVIAKDHPSFQVSITYLGLKNQDQVVQKLAKILDDPEITPEYINNLIKEHQYRLYEPIVVKRNISTETVTKIESRRRELPGVTIEPAPERQYPYGEFAGHVIGFLGEIDKELGEPGYEDYKLGDLIGKFGVEKQYDKYLRGKEGFRQVEVNVKNRPIREVSTVPPEPGNNIVLTIDFDLQKVMEEAFDNVLTELQKNPRSDKANAGAAVLLDVKTGEVLAMVTRPADRIRVENKAIQGRYIPGSTFKMVTGMAALEDKKVNPEEKIYCSGRYWKPPYIKCHDVHGPVNLYSAIAKSCNVYFQEMGRRVGIDKITVIGSQFGLDKPTGIDLPYESKGASALEGLPTLAKRLQYFDWAKIIVNKRYENLIKEKEDYYRKEFERLNLSLVENKINNEQYEKQKKQLEWRKEGEINKLKAQWKIDLNWNTTWHAYDTYNISIGQGRQNYTPLQLANYVAGIANNGILYKPYIVKKIIDNEGNIIKENKPQILKKANVSQKTLDEIKKGMAQTTQPGGTAYFLFYRFPEDIKVAAKTGTAQPGRAGYKVDGKQYYDGLFVAFAPVDNPQIAFAGVVEYGYSGATSAGKIAKAVFEEYFGLNQKNDKGVEEKIHSDVNNGN